MAKKSKTTKLTLPVIVEKDEDEVYDIAHIQEFNIT